MIMAALAPAASACRLRGNVWNIDEHTLRTRIKIWRIIKNGILFKRSFISNLSKAPTVFLLSDSLIIPSSLYLSFLLRFEFDIRPAYQRMIIEALPLFLFVKLTVFALFRMYKITWRYVGINELFNIVNATVVTNSVLLVFIWVPLPPSLEWFKLPELAGFPRSIFLIDGAVSILLISGLRMSKRFFLEVILKMRYTGRDKRTIIIGAGNTGRMILFSDPKPKFIVGDMRDRKKVERVMADYRSQVVFHAAAYKHVPLMEYNPAEAVKVNIFGTYNLAKASALYGVKKFIMISTDKAVRPINTKRYL